MIKLSKYLYIHWLTIAMFAAAYITRTLSITASVYSVMLLHEIAHTLAALFLKLGVSHIVMYPFGVTLKIKSRILCSVSDEMLLYLSGPAVNAITAAICAGYGKTGLFYYNNLFLFVLNLLPITPLDGGWIAERLLSAKVGYYKARIIMRIFAVLFALVLAGSIVFLKGIDFNSFVFCAFILASVFTQKSKYNRDFVRELIFYERKRKDIAKAEIYIADENVSKRKILQRIKKLSGSIVAFTDADGNISSIATGINIADSILENSNYNKNI